MRVQDSVEQIFKEFNFEYDPKLNISQFGGLETLMAFINQGNLIDRVQSEFGYFKTRTIFQILLGIAAGSKSMSDISRCGKDPLFIKYLKDTVGEAQLGRDLKSFSRQQVESFHDFNISLAVMDLVQNVSPKETLVFDIDATPVEKYGSQEGVSKGYVGKELPENCYQYLFVRNENRNSILYGTIREGSSHSQNGFVSYLEKFLPSLKKQWKSSWRGDSGYFNEGAFDCFSENDAQFFIKAPMSGTRHNLVQTSPDIIWSEEENGVSYSCRQTKTEKGTVYREVFKRTNRNKNQLSFGDIGNFRYDCIATNDLVSEPHDVFDFYNRRANIENNIKELKYDYSLGKIITDKFNANDVITQITILTYVLIQHFKNEVLPPKHSRNTLSTLRNHVFNIPARFIFSANRVIARVQNIFFCKQNYYLLFLKIKKLRSWLLLPPTLQN